MVWYGTVAMVGGRLLFYFLDVERVRGSGIGRYHTIPYTTILYLLQHCYGIVP